jgi:hypothetical protein
MTPYEAVQAHAQVLRAPLREVVSQTFRVGGSTGVARLLTSGFWPILAREWGFAFNIFQLAPGLQILVAAGTGAATLPFALMASLHQVPRTIVDANGQVTLGAPRTLKEAAVESLRKLSNPRELATLAGARMVFTIQTAVTVGLCSEPFRDLVKSGLHRLSSAT